MSLKSLFECIVNKDTVVLQHAFRNDTSFFNLCVTITKIHFFFEVIFDYSRFSVASSDEKSRQDNENSNPLCTIFDGSQFLNSVYTAP